MEQQPSSEATEKEQKPNRIADEHGRMVFPPGVSGNPAGRPAGTRNFTTKVREALEKIADGKEYTYEEAFIKSILKKAIVDGDSSTQRLIWNYLDGIPHQKIDVTSDGKAIKGNSIVLTNFTDETGDQ